MWTLTTPCTLLVFGLWAASKVSPWPLYNYKLSGKELSGGATGFLPETLMTRVLPSVFIIPKDSLFTYLIWSAVELPDPMALFDAVQHLTTFFDSVLEVPSGQK